MLQIAICDDEVTELAHTYALAEAYREKHPELDIAVRKFQSGYDLLEAVEARGRFDVYLLDILMPVVNGIEIGVTIRQKDSAAILIYLTSSSDYAVESYMVEAQGYLLKPFSEQQLFSALDKATTHMDAEDKRRLVLQTPGGGVETIPYCRLLYVEYAQHRLIAHRLDVQRTESVYQRESFEQLAAPLMADGRFVKISAAHIVNMQHVSGVTSRQFKLVNGETLPLSRVYAGARQTYMDYLLERGMST